MLRDQNVGVGAEPLERRAQVFRPGAGVPDFGATKRQQVVHGLGGVLRQVQHAVLWEEEVHLGGRFGGRCELKHDRDAVDRVRLKRLRN